MFGAIVNGKITNRKHNISENVSWAGLQKGYSFKIRVEIRRQIPCWSHETAQSHVFATMCLSANDCECPRWLISRLQINCSEWVNIQVWKPWRFTIYFNPSEFKILYNWSLACNANSTSLSPGQHEHWPGQISCSSPSTHYFLIFNCYFEPCIFSLSS